MDFIVKTCIALSVIALACLIGWLAFKLKRMFESHMLLRLKDRSLVLIHKLLEVNYKSAFQLHCVMFPYNISRNSKLFFTDAILVTQGGVLIIAMRNLHGSIDNPYRMPWRQFYKGSCVNLNNPLESLESQKLAIGNYLKSKNIANVPIYCAVVYVDPKVRFKISDIHEIVSVDKLIPFIHDISKDVMLKKGEMNAVANALRAAARKPQSRPDAR